MKTPGTFASVLHPSYILFDGAFWSCGSKMRSLSLLQEFVFSRSLFVFAGAGYLYPYSGLKIEGAHNLCRKRGTVKLIRNGTRL